MAQTSTGTLSCVENVTERSRLALAADLTAADYQYIHGDFRTSDPRTRWTHTPRINCTCAGLRRGARPLQKKRAHTIIATQMEQQGKSLLLLVCLLYSVHSFMYFIAGDSILNSPMSDVRELLSCKPLVSELFVCPL